MKRIPIILVAVVAVAVVRSPESTQAAVVTQPVPASACTLQCADNPGYCAEGEHDAWDYIVHPGTKGGEPHTVQQPCRTGTCAQYHQCAQSFYDGGLNSFEYDLEALRGAIQDGSAEELARMLRNAPRRLVASEQRSAVQVLDCTGKLVVAHLPVSKRLLTAINRIDGTVVTH